jgi:hypothetical protein
MKTNHILAILMLITSLTMSCAQLNESNERSLSLDEQLAQAVDPFDLWMAVNVRDSQGKHHLVYTGVNEQNLNKALSLIKEGAKLPKKSSHFLSPCAIQSGINKQVKQEIADALKKIFRAFEYEI